jgi:hypothetical protein
MHTSLPQKIDLPCLGYFRNVLSSGRALSHAIFENVDLSDGIVQMCPRVSGALTSAEDYEVGGVIPSLASARGIVPVPQEANEILYGKIHNYLHDITCAIVLEDNIFEASDKGCANRLGDALIFENELYFAITAFEDEKKVRNIFRKTSNVHGNIAILLRSEGVDLKSQIGPLIKGGEFKKVLQFMEGLVVTAFDGEGWIWWQPAASIRGGGAI